MNNLYLVHTKNIVTKYRNSFTVTASSEEEAEQKVDAVLSDNYKVTGSKVLIPNHQDNLGPMLYQ